MKANLRKGRYLIKSLLLLVMIFTLTMPTLTTQATGTTEVWIKDSGNPVVTGEAGSMVLDPSVFWHPILQKYMMFYTHVDGTGTRSIWTAWSSDAITWNDHQLSLAPSGIPGNFDEVGVANPSAYFDPLWGSYKMFFSGLDANGVWRVGVAVWDWPFTGWNRLGGEAVLDVGAPGSWDSQMVREPSVIYETGTGTYKMWYAGTASWPVFKIGYAESLDGLVWTKSASNPVFSGTPGGWDGFQVYAPSVVWDGSTYHMFFPGTDDNMSARWSTGHATSSDGIVWTETARNPILIPDGTNDSLDYVGAMNDGGAWKLWYSYGGAYAIGLAELTSDTQLWLDPAVASIPIDNLATQTFTVRIANALDLYGYQFVITFDPLNLEATAAAFDDSFFTNPLGSPPGWNATIDNINGKISFVRSRQSPDAPLVGDGPLATVTFRSKSGAAAAPYQIGFDQDILANIDGEPLLHTTQYAWLSLFGSGNLQGLVDLQGRSDEDGGTVTVLNASGYLASTTVAADGSWSFASIPAGSYQVNIEMERYLDAQKGERGGGVAVLAGDTTSLSEVKLLGGDANDDDIIDISDAVIIGTMFGKSGGDLTDPRADINDSGIVDVLDLVLMGGNYAKTSPVPWP